MQHMDPGLVKSTLRELGVGTFVNLKTAKHDTPLIDILRLFASKRISSLPIVDDDSNRIDLYLDIVMNVYEKYDVLVVIGLILVAGEGRAVLQPRYTRI